MDLKDGSIRQSPSRAERKDSSKSCQQQSSVVFPPCVVDNIQAIALKSMESHNSQLAAAGDSAPKKHIPAVAENGTFTPADHATVEGAANGTRDVARNGKKSVELTGSSDKKRPGCLTRASSFITWSLETGFYRLGLFVGTYPVLVILTMVIMCALCGLGMKTFHETQEQEKLWVPQSSRLIREKAWADRTFPDETRFVSIISVQKTGNILRPVAINALLDYYLDSLSLTFEGKRFLDMCVRVGPFCYVSSLLELWYFNATVIQSLSADDVIITINRTATTPMSGRDVKTLLGGELTYNEHGQIVGAQATQMTWVLRKEFNSSAAEFEKSMIQRAKQGHLNLSENFVYATRSFDDEGYGAINSDIKLLSTGFSIVFLFIMLSLGRFNLMEQKIYVSLAGMACVGLSILAAYGVATSFSVMYSPIQSIMPFLLLGIGVDDMFVVIETWKNLNPEEDQLDVPRKMALTLSRAGVSITVTSLTDVVAFGISASTSIPALSGFSIYATLGIFFLYLLVSTLFAGVLALDERRRKSGRDACLVCYKHSPSYSPNKCSSGKPFLQIFFQNYYGKLLTRMPVKILIIIVAIAGASLGLWRFIYMKRDFDLTNYIPRTSYAHSFVRAKENYFDRQGVDTNVYCGEIDYFQEIARLEEMLQKISDSPYTQAGTVNSWFSVFARMVQMSGQTIASREDFHHKLFQFLHTPVGQRLASFIKLNSTTEPVSIVASYITLRHVRQPDSEHDALTMDDLRLIVDSMGFPKFGDPELPLYKCFTYSRDYMVFETNKVLHDELYRNLGLSAAAVFLVTLILIANLWTSLLVFVCVILTIVDVGGVLEMWDVTIDTASSILLTLSVGLAVDYSAHVGHMFMTISGSKNGRMVATLASIGPAVFNGGFSTFLAFVLLADSASYGFQMFFKVFFSVVLFGLFHGLAFLPVVLSLVGARAYQHSDVAPPIHGDRHPGQAEADNHLPEQSLELPLSAAYKQTMTEDQQVEVVSADLHSKTSLSSHHLPTTLSSHSLPTRLSSHSLPIMLSSLPSPVFVGNLPLAPELSPATSCGQDLCQISVISHGWRVEPRDPYLNQGFDCYHDNL